MYAQHDGLHILIHCSESTNRAIDSTAILGWLGAPPPESLEISGANREILRYREYFIFRTNSATQGIKPYRSKSPHDPQVRALAPEHPRASVRPVKEFRGAEIRLHCGRSTRWATTHRLCADTRIAPNTQGK